MKQAAICTIGDEILIGQIVDTNSSFIAKKLNSIGIRIQSMLSIADDNDQIVNSLDQCLKDNDIVIVTGGLGPTKDDITKKALASLYGSSRFVTDTEQLAIVKRIIAARGGGMTLSQINRDQASVPEGCKVIANKLGTAPCMSFHFPKEKYAHAPILYSLPGVPFETMALLPDVIDDIVKSKELQKITHKTLLTFGIAESTLSDMIEDWENALPDNLKLAYLPNTLYGVRLRLSIYGDDGDKGKELIEKEFAKLVPILGDHIYGENEDNLQTVIGRLLLKDRSTLGCAESCTGGTLSSLITSVPGSSAYYRGSVTSYHNEVKRDVLGVKTETLEKYGAVSAECVCEMAAGAIKALNCDFSIATSGIAGPGGGTDEKPVGSVWIAIGERKKDDLSIKTTPYFLKFSSDRKRNMERFSANGLNLLRLALLASSRK